MTKLNSDDSPPHTISLNNTVCKGDTDRTGSFSNASHDSIAVVDTKPSLVTNTPMNSEAGVSTDISNVESSAIRISNNEEGNMNLGIDTFNQIFQSSSPHSTIGIDSSIRPSHESHMLLLDDMQRMCDEEGLTSEAPPSTNPDNSCATASGVNGLSVDPKTFLGVTPRTPKRKTSAAINRAKADEAKDSSNSDITIQGDGSKSIRAITAYNDLIYDENDDIDRCSQRLSALMVGTTLFDFELPECTENGSESAGTIRVKSAGWSPSNPSGNVTSAQASTLSFTKSYQSNPTAAASSIGTATGTNEYMNNNLDSHSSPTDTELDIANMPGLLGLGSFGGTLDSSLDSINMGLNMSLGGLGVGLTDNLGNLASISEFDSLSDSNGTNSLLQTSTPAWVTQGDTKGSLNDGGDLGDGSSSVGGISVGVIKPETDTAASVADEKTKQQQRVLLAHRQREELRALKAAENNSTNTTDSSTTTNTNTSIKQETNGGADDYPSSNTDVSIITSMGSLPEQLLALQTKILEQSASQNATRMSSANYSTSPKPMYSRSQSEPQQPHRGLFSQSQPTLSSLNEDRANSHPRLGTNTANVGQRKRINTDELRGSMAKVHRGMSQSEGGDIGDAFSSSISASMGGLSDDPAAHGVLMRASSEYTHTNASRLQLQQALYHRQRQLQQLQPNSMDDTDPTNMFLSTKAVEAANNAVANGSPSLLARSSTTGGYMPAFQFSHSDGSAQSPKYSPALSAHSPALSAHSPAMGGRRGSAVEENKSAIGQTWQQMNQIQEEQLKQLTRAHQKQRKLVAQQLLKQHYEEQQSSLLQQASQIQKHKEMQQRHELQLQQQDMQMQLQESQLQQNDHQAYSRSGSIVSHGQVSEQEFAHTQYNETLSMPNCGTVGGNEKKFDAVEYLASQQQRFRESQSSSAQDSAGSNGTSMHTRQPSITDTQSPQTHATPSPKTRRREERTDKLGKGKKGAGKEAQTRGSISSTYPNAENTVLKFSDVYEWLHVHFEECERAFTVPRTDLYNMYCDHCGKKDVAPAYQPTVGKVVRIAFPDVTIRRLGNRKNSKYHYCGIKLKPEFQPYYETLILDIRNKQRALKAQKAAEEYQQHHMLEREQQQRMHRELEIEPRLAPIQAMTEKGEGGRDDIDAQKYANVNGTAGSIDVSGFQYSAAGAE